jgi:hypothetical protein
MSDTFTGETYNTLCKDAEDYLAKGFPEQARELLQKAISLIGTRPVARSLLADTCMTMELWSEAREQLEILITLDEGNPNNHFRLAQVLEELGEYQLAADNYQVVLDSDPKHHGASVAIKRMASRDKDTGINLADVFNEKSQEDTEEVTAEEVSQVRGENRESVREGMQIYPDVPSDDIFAESEDDEDDDSVDALLKNIGLSGGSPSDDDDEADVSRLLENIGVSTSSTLAAAFIDPEEAEAAEKKAASEEAMKERRKKMVSLDEIFGTSSREAEPEKEEPAADESGEIEYEEVAFGGIEHEEAVSAEVTEHEEAVSAEVTEHEEAVSAEVTEYEEPISAEIDEREEAVAEEEPEIEPEEEPVPSAEASEDAGGSAADAGKTLEDIFMTAEEEPASEVLEEETAEAETPPRSVEVEKQEIEAAEEAVSAEIAEHEKAGEVPEPEVSPAELSPAEEAEMLETLVMKHEADYTIDTWSPESGLLTVTMTSGTIEVEYPMLTVIEQTLHVEPAEDGVVSISGQGTFLLNCGTEAPLRVDVRENMVIRKEAVVLHTGEIGLELLDIPDNGSLYVVKDSGHESVVFRAEKPVRVILLGQNNRVFLVRTSSIMATDPDIILSGSEGGFTEVSGSGKVYLIE